MRNGIFFTLIVFVGTLAFTVVSRVNETLDAGIAFLLASIVIGYLSTHFKKNRELASIQKIILITFIGLFTIYGFLSAIPLITLENFTTPAIVEGLMFMAGSIVLTFCFVMFIREYIYNKYNNKKQTI